MKNLLVVERSRVSTSSMFGGTLNADGNHADDVPQRVRPRPPDARPAARHRCRSGSFREKNSVKFCLKKEPSNEDQTRPIRYPMDRWTKWKLSFHLGCYF